MSGIGFWELIVLFLVGLIVLGPERLPRVANQLGGWMGQARRMTRVMKRQLEDEIDFEKDLGLKTPPGAEATVSNPQYVHDNKTPEHDDSYSPMHGPTDSGAVDDIDDESGSSGDEAAAVGNDMGEADTDSEKKAPA